MIAALVLTMARDGLLELDGSLCQGISDHGRPGRRERMRLELPASIDSRLAERA